MVLILIDDDHRFLASLEMALQKDYQIHTCSNLPELRHKVQTIKANLLICDYDLGHESIEHYLKEKPPELPILVITGKATRENIISLLNHGVAGFLEKPVELSELKKHIERITSLKVSPLAAAAKKIKIGFDPHYRKVEFEGGSQDLTPIEYKILTFFLSHFEKPVQKTDIQNYLWPNVTVAQNTLDTHLSNLRKKIPPLKEHLTSIYGGEYVLKASTE